MDVHTAARKLSALTLSSTVAELPLKPPARHVEYAYEQAHAMLLKAYHKLPKRPPLSRTHALQLLKPASDGDLSLLTAAGVEFRVHSRMLVGGPAYLEAQLLRDESPHQQQNSSIALPKECHPILVDRFISFLYTKDYDIPPCNGLLYSDHGKCNLTNASFIPKYNELPSEITVLLDALRHVFHLHMYALGERLQYEALMMTARDKLWDILHGTMRSSTAMGARWILRDCVDACFAVPGCDARVCADGDSALGQVIVTAVLANEVSSWNKAQRNGLCAYLPEPQYKDFWDMYHGVKAENAELLASVSSEARHTSQGLKRSRKESRNRALAEIRRAQDDLTGKLLTALPLIGDRGPAAHTPNSVISEDAQRRRDKKEMLRHTLTEKTEEKGSARPFNVKAFDNIDTQEAVDLATLMGATPAQIQGIIASHQIRETIGTSTHQPPPAMALTYRTKDGGIQRDQANEDERYSERINNYTSVNNDQVPEAEIQDGIRLMRIHDSA